LIACPLLQKYYWQKNLHLIYNATSYWSLDASYFPCTL